MTRQVTFDWQTNEDVYLRRAARHFSAVQGAAYADALPVVQPSHPAFAYAGPSHAVYDDALDAGAPVRDGEREVTLFTLRALAVLLFVLLAAGGAPMSPDQVDRAQIERELTLMLEQDVAATRARDRDRYRALIDPDISSRWVDQWRDHWSQRSETGLAYSVTLGPTQRVNEETVRAEVYVTLPRTHWWQPASVREARFYRSVNGQWLRTLPPDDFWGEPQTLRSRRYVIHHYEADASSVQEAADRLDSAIAELYEIFHLPDNPDDRMRVIVLRPGDENPYIADRRAIEVMSPAVTEIARQVTDADYLAELIFSSSTARIFDLRGGGYRWSFLYAALRGWLSSELLGQPRRSEHESDGVFRTYTAALYPLQLSDIDEYFVGGEPGRETVLWRYAAATVLLDYMISLEGAEVLPELIAAFKTHNTWGGLIKTVFGMTEQEFTDGWNEYLYATYGFGTREADNRRYGD